MSREADFIYHPKVREAKDAIEFPEIDCSKEEKELAIKVIENYLSETKLKK